MNYSQNSTQSYECDYGYDCKAQDCDMNDDMNALNIHLNRCVTKSVNNASKSLWSIDLSIKDNDYISFKIDTGAECTILSRKTYIGMQTKPLLQPSKVAIRGLLGSPAKPMGTIELPVSHKGKMYQLHCEVLDGYNVPNLLSESDSVRMNLIKRIDHTEIDDRGIDGAKAIMKRYDDVFQGVGKIPGKYSLHIDPNAKPVAHPSRPIPAPLREPARQKLNQLVDMGILEKVPVGEPTPWVSALHVVNKKSLGPQRRAHNHRPKKISIEPCCESITQCPPLRKSLLVQTGPNVALCWMSTWVTFRSS